MRTDDSHGRSVPERARLERLAAIAAALVLALVAMSAWQAPGTRAATPASGTVDSTNPSVRWTGGPFLGFTWLTHTDCVVPQATFCDTFILHVGTLPATTPDVVVSVVGSEYYDEFNIVIADSAGQIVARSTAASPHTVLMETPPPGTYEVRVELMNGSLRLTTYEGHAFAADAGPPAEFDPEVCPLPDWPVVLEPDDGRWVDLDVLVMLDGVSQAYAESLFADVARAYERLKVRVVPTFEVPDPPIASEEIVQMMDDVRGRLPLGQVPAEYDVVHILSSKDLRLGANPDVIGMADCIGGIAHDDRAFSVAQTGFAPEGMAVGPLTLRANLDPELSTHEIGHLLGGEHHLANCVEEIDPDDELAGEFSPCTVMMAQPELQGLHFGSVNGRIVRQFALRYASANDA